MTEGPIKGDAKPHGVATEVSKRLSLRDRALHVGLWVGGFVAGLMASLVVAEGIRTLGEHLQQ